MTILGDIYTLQERANVQGYVASVWAMAALIGPTLGGVFSDTIGWRWIFFVNLPLGAAAALGAVAAVRGERRAPPSTGSTTSARRCSASAAPCCCSPCSRAASVGLGLAGRASALFAPPAFCWSRSSWSSGGPPSRSCRCGCSGCGSSTSPTPARSWSGSCSWGSRRTSRSTPSSVLGTGALVAGLALAAMTIGWPIAAATAGRHLPASGSGRRSRSARSSRWPARCCC